MTDSERLLDALDKGRNVWRKPSFWLLIAWAWLLLGFFDSLQGRGTFAIVEIGVSCVLFCTASLAGDR